MRKVALPFLLFFLILSISVIVVLATTFSSELNPIMTFQVLTGSNEVNPSIMTFQVLTGSNELEPIMTFQVLTGSNEVNPSIMTFQVLTGSNELEPIMSVSHTAYVSNSSADWLSYPVASATSVTPGQSIRIEVNVTDSGAPASEHDVYFLVYPSSDSSHLMNYTGIYEGGSTFYTIIDTTGFVGCYNLEILVARKSTSNVKDSFLEDYGEFFCVGSSSSGPSGGGTIPTTTTSTTATTSTTTTTSGGSSGSGSGAPSGGSPSSGYSLISVITEKGKVRIVNPFSISSIPPPQMPQTFANITEDNVKVIFVGVDRVLYGGQEVSRLRLILKEERGIPTIVELEFENMTANSIKAVLSNSVRVDVLSGSAIIKVALLPLEQVTLDIYTPDGPEGSILSGILRYLSEPAFWTETYAGIPIFLVVASIIFGIILVLYQVYLRSRRGEASFSYYGFRFFRLLQNIYIITREDEREGIP